MDNSSNEKQSAKPCPFQMEMERILVTLKSNPMDITADDARRLSEHVVAKDQKSARIISAVNAYALANEEIKQKDLALDQTPHISILTVVKDLEAAVDQSPEDINVEVLRTAQNIVSKMQKAVGHTHVPHPEVEAELQEEIAKIEPKIAQGTVTKAEANHLHSLEARAYGHTEKGGVAATAQSVVAKRGRQLSLSSGSGTPAYEACSHEDSGCYPSAPNNSPYEHRYSYLGGETFLRRKIEQDPVTDDPLSSILSWETPSPSLTGLFKELPKGYYSKEMSRTHVNPQLPERPYPGQDIPLMNKADSANISEKPHHGRKIKGGEDSPLHAKDATVDVEEKPENDSPKPYRARRSEGHNEHSPYDKDIASNTTEPALAPGSNDKLKHTSDTEVRAPLHEKSNNLLDEKTQRDKTVAARIKALDIQPEHATPEMEDFLARMSEEAFLGAIANTKAEGDFVVLATEIYVPEKGEELEQRASTV